MGGELIINNLTIIEFSPKNYWIDEFVNFYQLLFPSRVRQ